MNTNIWTCSDSRQLSVICWPRPQDGEIYIYFNNGIPHGSLLGPVLFTFCILLIFLIQWNALTDKIYVLSRLFWTICNANVHEKELKRIFQQTKLFQRICNWKFRKSWKTEQLLTVQRAFQTDTLPSCSTGMCDDRGVWVGVHHPHLVSRMLLSLQRMAGTPTLRPQAFLCYRWAFFVCSFFYLVLVYFPSSRLISDRCQPGRSQGRFQGTLVCFCPFPSEVIRVQHISFSTV